MPAASKDEPVRLTEDITGDRVLIYGTDRGVKVELRYAGETLWATQDQMADMFGVDRTSITKHLKNIYDEGDLDKSATCEETSQVREEGTRRVVRNRPIYNLNAVISVGYRVSSKQGTLFRIWATDTLVQFATKGFVVDAARLKNPEEHDRVRELRDIIRDIRSDEANVYREIRRICALCQDYDGKSGAWREFYTRMQAKLLWAVTSSTPAMILSDRADGTVPNMGLRSWSKEAIRQQHALVAKNYLAERELGELNRVTTILLDIFEDQLDIGKLNTMAEVERMLDAQLKSLNRSVLSHGGSVSATQAERRVKEQYRIFDEKRRAERHADADAYIADLVKKERELPKARGKKSRNDSE